MAKSRICQALGPVVAQEPCPCGAIVDVHHCAAQNQSCVRTQYAWEQSFDFRSANWDSPDGSKYRAADHARLIKICEKCQLNTTKAASAM